ncbi:MAG: radical SAM protein [Myxococcales bacterium]|nr:radical SAM protein [Myxococcales bacterium]
MSHVSLRRRLPLAPEARPIDRELRPIYAVWEVTLRCDLACRHCGSRAGHARPDELTTEEALGLVRQLAELGVKEVTLIGGEAYLRPDWLAIIEAVRAAGMQCTMTTGGRGIDRGGAEAAAAAGLGGVALSIDGTAGRHDAIRGHGSFEAAVGAMDAFSAAGVPVSVNTQIGAMNRDDVPGLLDVLIDHGVHAWQVSLVVPMGRAADEPELLLQPYELLDVFPMLAAEAERARGAGIRFVRGNNLGYFGPYESVFQADDPIDYACGCGAGRQVIGIEADGAIKGCPSLATVGWSGGTVREFSLRDLWERSMPLRALREPRASMLSGFCAGCYYGPECGGGCTWMADSLLGRPGDNPYCHHRVLELQRRGQRERVVRVAAPPGLSFDRGRFAIVVEPLE